MLLWTATIQKRPSVSFSEARRDLLHLIQKTAAGSWLKRRGVIGTARLIENEHPDGSWHVHAHVILVFRNSLSRDEAVVFAIQLRDRYLGKADALSIPAGKQGQHVMRGSKEGLIRYVTKDVTRLGGYNTSSKLWEQVAAGDADALALIHEMEAGNYRKRNWTVTGVCKLAQVEDFDELLAKLGWDKQSNETGSTPFA